MNQKQSWEETLEKIIRGILSRYEDKFNFDFKAAERSWGKKVGMENFLREEFSSAIKQAIQTREREISEEIKVLVARLYSAAGCGCCQDTKEWEKVSGLLAVRFGVPPYKDGSGYDFYSIINNK